MGIPPARFAILGGVVASGMVVPRQRVANQHCVRTLGVQRAVGLIDQFVLRQRFATGKRQRRIKLNHVRGHKANGVRWPVVISKSV